MTTGQILNSVNFTNIIGPLASVLPFAVGYGYAPVVIVIVSDLYVMQNTADLEAEQAASRIVDKRSAAAICVPSVLKVLQACVSSARHSQGFGDG